MVFRMLAGIKIVRVIRYNDIVVTEFNMCFDDHNLRRYSGQCIPYPIVITVYIYRQQAYFILKSLRRYKFVDILPVYFSANKFWWIIKWGRIFTIEFPTAFYTFFIAVDE